ncbi:unnamed protein product [Durusdinium trenchii]|uniref:Uncharacterized protein n=1 Tax=Durusdinium trenchii TaxID=1381693 RepID=A0ABP0R7C9_9DINO
MGILSWLRDDPHAFFCETDTRATGLDVCPSAPRLNDFFGKPTSVVSFYSSGHKHRTEGYWAVPNEKCLTHRSLWRELYGASVGPEHYCVNQNASKDFRGSNGSEAVQKCYDFDDCRSRPKGTSGSGQSGHGREVRSTDPDYPNTVVFLTPEAYSVPLSYFISWMFRTFEDHIEERLTVDIDFDLPDTFQSREWRTDAELEKFASSLPPGLEKLGLSFVCPDQFTDRGLALIGSGLPATLKHLALAFEFSWTECHISKEGFGKLVVGFPKGLSSLDLTLRNDELGDEALEMLAKAMPPSLSKAVINFKDNDSFTDAGFCALIGGFPSSLKELSLNFDTNGRLSDVTLKTLAAWLSKTGGLRKPAGETAQVGGGPKTIEDLLQFISNSTHQVSKQGLQELCSSLPSLRQLRLEFQSSDAPELCDQFVVKDESIAFVKDKALFSFLHLKPHTWIHIPLLISDADFPSGLVPRWQELLQTINAGAEAFKSGDFGTAKVLLADAAESATKDEQQAFTCSLGISALYRALAYAYCSHVHGNQRITRRLNQIGLRFLHLAMNWLTHAFVTTNHNQALIDGSAWPIGIQEINNDLTSVVAALQSSGTMGHSPTAAGKSIPHDFRLPDLRIAIVSLCAYPPDHPLPRFSSSNQGTYAARHGYTCDTTRRGLSTCVLPCWNCLRSFG